MNKKGQENKLLTIIVLAMLVFIALAFITSVANTKAKQTDLLSSANESSNLTVLGCYEKGGTINITNTACNITVSEWYATGDWRASESQCYLTGVKVTNNTGVPLTLNTDYQIFASTGKIRLLNTSTMYNSSNTMSNNVIKVSYNYCGSGYLKSSGDRSLANLWTTMMIILLVVIIAGSAYKVMKEK